MLLDLLGLDFLLNNDLSLVLLEFLSGLLDDLGGVSNILSDVSLLLSSGGIILDLLSSLGFVSLGLIGSILISWGKFWLSICLLLNLLYSLLLWELLQSSLLSSNFFSLVFLGLLLSLGSGISSSNGRLGSRFGLSSLFLSLVGSLSLLDNFLIISNLIGNSV